MAAALSIARMKFLDASAHYYSTLAPATSAHLMLERMAVAANNEATLAKRPGSDDACGACGTIRIPGLTSKTTIVEPTKSKKVSHKRNKQRQSEATANRPTAKQLVVECLTCHRITPTPLQPSQGHRVRRQRGSGSTATFGAQTAEPVPLSTPAFTKQAPSSEKPVSANSSSKKRAKTRKQGGLQAMLEKSKESGKSPSGFALDLMDFMKQV